MTLEAMAGAAGQCLIASYPKSGNTWMRALLTSLLQPDRPLVLDDLLGHTNLVDSSWASEEFGVDVTELGVERLDEMRATLLRDRHDELRAAGELEFVKLHGANRALESGRRLADASAGRAIVLVRHPFDIVASYAEFVRSDPDMIIDAMTRPDAQIDRTGRSRPHRLPETQQSWALHAASWCIDPPLPTAVVRYEDLLERPVVELGRVAEFLGFDPESAELDSAVAACRFERLQQTERRQGIAWKPHADVAFFRAGTAGNGSEVLTQSQRDRLVVSAGVMMQRLGYLPDGTCTHLGNSMWTEM